MGPAELASYLGPAAAFAVAATVLGLALARLLVAFPVRPAAGVALPTLFFLALAFHPFPSRAGLGCPNPDGEVRLTPLGLLSLFADAWGRRRDPVTWLLETGPASTLMNLAICAAIGWALARAGASVRGALAFGAALSLGIEMTQVTGLWGLYPCAYRQFDVDDLILNAGGAALGAWAARRRPVGGVG